MDIGWVGAGFIIGTGVCLALLVMAPDLGLRFPRRQPKKAPRGIGPCGVARVTYPMLRGLEVRELRHD